MKIARNLPVSGCSNEWYAPLPAPSLRELLSECEAKGVSSVEWYTGTNFNRPGFQKLLEDIELGFVSTVIVKDMSRLGRDYLQVGY